jgi:16S rRNA (guanine1207-N2)-methyltransferase
LGADVNTMQNIGAAAGRTGVYGTPSGEFLDLPANVVQFSPLMPGASALELQGEGTLASMTMLAPPGTLERRYAAKRSSIPSARSRLG